MAVTSADLAHYVGRSSDFLPADAPFVQRVIDSAKTLVGNLVNDDVTVPDDVYDLAVLTAASELWHRRNMPGGVMQIGTDGTGSIRLGYDVTRMVRPLLASYCVAI